MGSLGALACIGDNRSRRYRNVGYVSNSLPIVSRRLMGRKEDGSAGFSPGLRIEIIPATCQTW